MCVVQSIIQQEKSLCITQWMICGSHFSAVSNLTPLCEKQKGVGIHKCVVFYLLLNDYELHIINLDMLCFNT